VIAISSVGASDLNSTADVYSYDDSNFVAASQNASDVTVSDSNDGAELAETDSDALTGGKTVYFDASASLDGTGTKDSPYKYLFDERITSGMTAYFADGVYSYSGTATIGPNLDKTTFIGQSKDNTIIRSDMSYSFDLIVSSNSNLFLKDITFDYGHIVSSGIVEAENVIFMNSVRNYSAASSYLGCYSCGGVIFSSASGDGECSITLDNCYFKDNHARHGGVLVANYTNVLITNCVFYNSLSNRSGGAVYSLNSNLTISKSSFTRSNARYGGVIYGEKGIIRLFDSNFTSSQAYSFGGVIATQLSSLTSDNCIFYDYQSLTDSGGAIYSERGSVDIYASSFIDGVADFGGAICALNVDLNVANSNFQDNTANYGGSIFTMYKNLTVFNSKFTNSAAMIYGGAICSYLAASIELANNVFVNSNDIYVFEKYDTVFKQNQNTGLTNIRIVNTTLFDLSSNVIAPIIDYSSESQTNLPSYYSSKDYGYVTPVKNQMDGGNCWAFASIATLETCLKKATGITYDFSEENIKNLMAMYSLAGRYEYPNDGGFDSMALGYFTSWLGPINDYFDEYDDYSALSSMYSSLMHVQNIYFLPDRANTNDNDAIKKAILDYGAVSAAYFWITSNHAITLIGWDDNYNAKDYFGDYTKGAWIVKNSWGSEDGDDGYVYVSYERPFKSESSAPNYHNYIFTFILDGTEGYVRNYQYDINSVNYYQTSSETGVMYKNIFIAQENEMLAAFSTVFKQPTSYEVSLYKGDNLILTQRGYSPAGYYTIPFDVKTELSKGDEFTICIENLNSGEKFIPLSSAGYSNLGTFPEGVSFMNLGDGWYNLYSCYETPKVACIKAFTTPLTLNEVTLNVDKFSTVYVNEEVTINFKLSNSQLNRGLVTVKINNKTYYAEVYNGQASLKLKFNDLGTYDFKAQYKNNLYVSNMVSFNFDVVKRTGEIFIVAPDLSKYYGSSTPFSIRVTIGGYPVSGESVRFIKDGNVIDLTTNEDGYAYVNINLYPGTYRVTSECENKSVESTITVKSTVFVNDLSYDYDSSYLKASFYDVDGSALSNAQVNFKIGSSVYTAKTDANGLASYNVKLNVGSYDVDAVNPVNGETKSFKLTVNKVTPSISLVEIQNGELVTLTASLSNTAATGTVTFTVGINNFSNNSTLRNGKASLTYNGFEEATYSAYVTYWGDGNFNSVVSPIIYFDVLPAHGIVLIAPDLTKYYGSSDRFSIRVINNGQPVGGAKVRCIKDDTVLNLTTNADGYTYVEIELSPGKYYLKSEYGGKSVQSTVTVKSTISVNDLSYDCGSSYLKATFYDVDGNPLSNTRVKFMIKSDIYYATTDSMGLASCKVDLKADSYTVTAVNPTNNETKSFDLTVNKITPAISLSAIWSGELVMLTASLSNNSATGIVTFTIDESNELNNTLTNGKVSIYLEGVSEGNYDAYATYWGDEYFSAVKSSIVTIKSTISVKDLSYDYGSSYLKATFYDVDGKPLSNAQVKFKIGSNVYSATTDGNGIASYFIKLDCGSYAVTAVNPVSNEEKSFKLTVSYTTTISVKNLNKIYGDSKKLTITVKNNVGKLVSNDWVNIDVYDSNKKIYASYYLKTNTKGQINLDCNFKPASYSVDVSDGHGIYKANVVVKRATPKIIASSKTFKLKVKTKQYTITLKNNLNKVMKNTKVKLKVKGKTYAVKTKSNGKATFKITNLKKKGNFKAIITYSKTAYYNSVTKTVNIKIKK
jgi:C1A family cysteine protease